MNEEGRAEWIYLLNQMKCGQPEPGVTESVITVIEGCIESNQAALERSTRIMKTAGEREQEIFRLLGRTTMVQHRLTGYRDAKAKADREIARQEKARLLQLFDENETTRSDMQDWIIDMNTQIPLGRQIVERVKAGEYTDAAGPMERFWNLTVKWDNWLQVYAQGQAGPVN